MKKHQANKDQSLSVHHSSSKKRLLIIGISFSLILFVFYMFNSWRQASKTLEKNALDFAQTIEIVINSEGLEQLQGIAQDEGSEYYSSVKDKLMDLVQLHSEVRFIYLMKQRDGRIYFVVDSEPSDSEDYSPPGQEYTEADEETQNAFLEAQPRITDPSADRWGTWISVFVPLKSKRTGEVYALLGIDYPVSQWRKLIIAEITEDALYALGVVLLLLSFFLILSKNSSLDKQE
ncbi:MAG: hypothetical protein WCZ67_03240, partial [Bacteroidales bacterium]